MISENTPLALARPVNSLTFAMIASGIILVSMRIKDAKLFALQTLNGL